MTQRRKLLVSAVLALALVAYAALAIASWNRMPETLSFSSVAPQPRRSPAAEPPERPLEVYVDVLSIDPIRDSMDVRIDVSGGAGPHGTLYSGTSDRTIDVAFGDGFSDRIVRLERGRPLPSLPLTIDLTGSVESYPFDRYTGRIYIDAVEVVPGGRRRPLPVVASVWPGVSGWRVRVAAVHVAATGASADEDALHLALDVDFHRPRASTAYALTMYAVMLVLTISAAGIAWVVFFRIRRFEVSYVNLFAAMLVALPLLRTGMPGSPPLGVRIDLLILLWAEVVVAAALALAVIVWLRDAEPPGSP